MINIVNFIKIFVLFIILDLIWIKLVAGPKYTNMIFEIQNSEMKIKPIPAILTYVAMTLLLLLFVSSSDYKNFLLGALSYAIYDLTNLSLLDKFDANFALYDSLWGGILFLSVSRLSNLI